MQTEAAALYLSECPAAVDARRSAYLKSVVKLQSQQARGGYADKHEYDFSHAPRWDLLLRPAPTSTFYSVKSRRFSYCSAGTI